MKKQLLRYTLAGITIASTLLTVIPGLALAKEEDAPNVHFVATLNNGPAMQAVKWKVYRLNNDQSSSTLVESFERHSASLLLTPGRYLAEVQLNTVSRSRVFDVGGATKSDVVVAMD